VSGLGTVKFTNYLSVKSSKEFKKHMEEEFDYLVTPVAQNIVIYNDSEAWKAERVYGSPGNETPAIGTLVRMVLFYGNRLPTNIQDSTFPSTLEKDNPEMCKGAVVLVKLVKVGESKEPLTLRYATFLGYFLTS
jgi:hypothetical protein